MAQDDIGIRPLAETHLSEIDDLLAAEAFGEGNIARLRAALNYLRNFSLVAIRANRVEAAALASFNGWHIFLSHLVVAQAARNEGIAGLLLDKLVRTAAEVGAKGVIVDARLSAVGFFHQHGFRLPGALFLIKEIADH
jgi:predicted N-acetyltransferase YhbS